MEACILHPRFYRLICIITQQFRFSEAKAVLPNPVGGDPVAHDVLCLELLARSLDLPSFFEQRNTHQVQQKMGIHDTL